MDAHYDVVIIGGGLAGSSMGLLLKRARPGTTVLIIEKGSAFKLKVGESTSEVGAALPLQPAQNKTISQSAPARLWSLILK